MKRAVLGLGLAAMFVLAPVAAGTAAAAPPIKTTILLTCDKNVSAQVTLTLLDSVGGAPVATTLTPADLSCGGAGNNRARVVVPTNVPAGAVLVSQFDTTSGSNTRDCSSLGVVLPATFVCAMASDAIAQLSLK
jgi:hypothetical protein